MALLHKTSHRISATNIRARYLAVRNQSHNFKFVTSGSYVIVSRDCFPRIVFKHRRRSVPAPETSRNQDQRVASRRTAYQNNRQVGNNLNKTLRESHCSSSDQVSSFFSSGSNKTLQDDNQICTDFHSVLPFWSRPNRQIRRNNNRAWMRILVVGLLLDRQRLSQPMSLPMLVACSWSSIAGALKENYGHVQSSDSLMLCFTWWGHADSHQAPSLSLDI